MTHDHDCTRSAENKALRHYIDGTRLLPAVGGKAIFYGEAAVGDEQPREVTTITRVLDSTSVNLANGKTSVPVFNIGDPIFERGYYAVLFDNTPEADD